MDNSELNVELILKDKILSFIHALVISKLYDLLYSEEDILKDVCKQKPLVLIDLHSSK